MTNDDEKCATSNTTKTCGNISTSDDAWIEEQAKEHTAINAGLDIKVKMAFRAGARAALERAKVREQKLVEALRFYADREDWHQFISSGGISGEADGDFMMAFDKGEDAPWEEAQEALKQLGISNE